MLAEIRRMESAARIAMAGSMGADDVAERNTDGGLMFGRGAGLAVAALVFAVVVLMI